MPTNKSKLNLVIKQLIREVKKNISQKPPTQNKLYRIILLKNKLLLDMNLHDTAKCIEYKHTFTHTHSTINKTNNRIIHNASFIKFNF